MVILEFPGVLQSHLKAGWFHPELEKPLFIGCLNVFRNEVRTLQLFVFSSYCMNPICN